MTIKREYENLKQRIRSGNPENSCANRKYSSSQTDEIHLKRNNEVCDKIF